jgi:hypothetical protein
VFAVLRGLHVIQLGHQRGELGLEPRLLLLEPRVAHRFVPRPVRPQLRAVHRHEPELHQPGPARQPDGRPQYPGEVLPMPPPEAIDRPEIWHRPVPRQIPES